MPSSALQVTLTRIEGSLEIALDYGFIDSASFLPRVQVRIGLRPKAWRREKTPTA